MNVPQRVIDDDLLFLPDFKCQNRKRILFNRWLVYSRHYCVIVLRKNNLDKDQAFLFILGRLICHLGLSDDLLAGNERVCKITLSDYRERMDNSYETLKVVVTHTRAQKIQLKQAASNIRYLSCLKMAAKVILIISSILMPYNQL